MDPLPGISQPGQRFGRNERVFVMDLFPERLPCRTGFESVCQF